NAFRSLLDAPTPAPTTGRRKGIAASHGVLSSSNGSPSSKKRTYSAAEGPSTTSRSIQPRPIAAALNGESPGPAEVSSSLHGASGDGDQPRKKRGRPTKAETEAKRQAAALKGEVYPPPKHQKTPRSSISGGRATATDAAAEANAAAPLAVMTPVTGSGFMSTPGTAGTGTDAPGTGGKRRRGRPTKAEAAAKRALMEAATVSGGDENKNDDDDGDDIEEGADLDDDDPRPNKAARSSTGENAQEGKGAMDMESGDMHLDP
ncbi:hypothetical protein GP486_004801, partial [Trichoglossum hirsutum]